MALTQTTKPNRPWLLKMSAFLIVLVGFGFYGLYDATVAYPNRGIEHASYLQYQYLEAAKQEGLSDVRTQVDDPAAELNRLKERGGPGLSGAEGVRFAWLSSLEVVNRLKPEFTRMPRPGQTPEEKSIEDTYKSLKARWTTSSGAKNAPKPLYAYDLKVQWLFTFLGLGGGVLMLLHIIRVLARKYRWDPEAKVLQLSDGSTLSPADIEEFDKRKWDKYLIFLKIKPGHAKHGGKELKLDLYQHAPLESWVLEMEKIAFPDQAQPPAAAESPTPPASPPGDPAPAA